MSEEPVSLLNGTFKGLFVLFFFFLLPKPESSILQKQCLGSNISSSHILVPTISNMAS